MLPWRSDYGEEIGESLGQILYSGGLFLGVFRAVVATLLTWENLTRENYEV